MGSTKYGDEVCLVGLYGPFRRIRSVVVWAYQLVFQMGLHLDICDESLGNIIVKLEYFGFEVVFS